MSGPGAGPAAVGGDPASGPNSTKADPGHVGFARDPFWDRRENRNHRETKWKPHIFWCPNPYSHMAAHWDKAENQISFQP